MRKDRILERIAHVFAEAVAEGDLAEADAWIAVARLCTAGDPIEPVHDSTATTTGA